MVSVMDRQIDFLSFNDVVEDLKHFQISKKQREKPKPLINLTFSPEPPNGFEFQR